MFTDNQLAQQVFQEHMRSATVAIAQMVDLLEPEAVTRVSESMQQGANLAIAVAAPAVAGGPTVLHLYLEHPTAGRMLLAEATTTAKAQPPAAPQAVH